MIAEAEPPRPSYGPVVGFWDYDASSHVVMIDTEGGSMIGCAWPPGDQLGHLGCPAEGPCARPAC